jgi:hypothetical protein
MRHSSNYFRQTQSSSAEVTLCEYGIQAWFAGPVEARARCCAGFHTYGAVLT